MTTRRATVQVILKDTWTSELVGPCVFSFEARYRAVLAIKTDDGWREVRQGDEVVL